MNPESIELHKPRVLRVLLDTRVKNWSQNPYISLLAEGIAPASRALGFSWRTAIFGRYDVVHLHWPEYLMRHRSTLGSILFKLLFVVWIAKIRLLKIPVLKTMHNQKPHDPPGRIQRLLLSTAERSYSSRIWLMDPPVDSPSDVCIPHGDYIPWLESLGFDIDAIKTANAEKLGRPTTHFLTFGVIKRYKTIHEPVKAIAGSKELNLRLGIMGNAPDVAYLGELRELAGHDPRITITPGRIEDHTLVREILASDVVVLPYRDLYNSGALLLALSLGRPVALRRSEVALHMLEEFGADWILIYEDEFSTSALEALAEKAMNKRPLRMISEKRDWSSISSGHNAAYRLVIGK